MDKFIAHMDISAKNKKPSELNSPDFLKVEKQVDPQWKSINSYDNPADMDF